jgi:hypothetical protein
VEFTDLERKKDESLEDFQARLEEAYKIDRMRKESEFKETQIKQ